MKSSSAPLAPLRNYISLRTLSETAVAAARKVGNIQKNLFQRDAKADTIHPRDVKMVVDRDCESAVVEIIRNRFPDHRILSEEGGDLGGSADYLWIVDPLDGTVNFFHGLPQFCSCVSCCYLPPGIPLPRTGDELLQVVLASAVVAPALDEIYVGVAGNGSTRNGSAIRCGAQKKLSDVIIALSFGKTEEGIDHIADLSKVLARRARKLRSFGSAGLDIAHVAAGRFGGLIYRGIHIWDIAAAGLILKESGGVLNASIQSDGKWNMVASVPGIYAELMELL